MRDPCLARIRGQHPAVPQDLLRRLGRARCHRLQRAPGCPRAVRHLPCRPDRPVFLVTGSGVPTAAMVCKLVAGFGSVGFPALRAALRQGVERRRDPRLVRRRECPALRPGRLLPGHLTIMPVIAAWSAKVIVSVSHVPSCSTSKGLIRSVSHRSLTEKAYDGCNACAQGRFSMRGNRSRPRESAAAPEGAMPRGHGLRWWSRR